MAIPLDYETLRVIWWLLLGVLLIGFALTDGFDLGAMALLPFVARTDDERRMTINAVAPTWEGNQVWFILGGGAIFAAWPYVYAASFSGFYLAMFLVLAALILRPVAFKYRSKHTDTVWRARWDWSLFTGGFVPALVFGVAVGNVLKGVPLSYDSDLRAVYHGSLFGLFTPFTLVCGLLSVAMLLAHGAAWLGLKVESDIVLKRARKYGAIAAVASFALFALGMLFIWKGGMGYALVTPINPQGDSNPRLMQSVAKSGAWLINYSLHPWTMLAPILGFSGSVLALVGFRGARNVVSITGSATAIIGIIGTVGCSMFPFILPSSIDPQSSLVVWNASSSHLTLWIMLLVTVIFLPIVLAYTSWAYRVMFGRITEEALNHNPDLY